jgi:3-deoxy-manno-octulosonate cytidylyltransferase (CMP-KDO synthetase)
VSDSVLAVIPARLASERLPEKPLQPIAGRPLIEWVWRRVRSMALFGEVVVATDHPKVESLCRAFGAAVRMTDPAHPSGTDRVAEVADLTEFRHHPFVVNIQGDEPLVEEAAPAAAVQLLRDGWELATCASPLGSLDAFHDPSVVKVARGTDGRALYFSRAPIPHLRGRTPDPHQLADIPFLRHHGLYACRREALLQWVSLPPSPLEEIERLEQLRALEAGIPFGVAVVADGAGGVDTAEDLARMEELLTGNSRPDRTATMGTHD